MKALWMVLVLVFLVSLFRCMPRPALLYFHPTISDSLSGVDLVTTCTRVPRAGNDGFYHSGFSWSRGKDGELEGHGEVMVLLLDTN